jgi:hypothetical protein
VEDRAALQKANKQRSRSRLSAESAADSQGWDKLQEDKNKWAKMLLKNKTENIPLFSGYYTIVKN